MTESHTKNKSILQLSATTGEEQAAKLAHVISSPSINAARLQLAFNPNQGLELMACVDDMRNQISELKKGSTVRIEAMLLAQAHSLQTMFTHYAHKMTSAEYLNQLKVNGALALKAQNQCRQTLQALAEIKNPKRATFIKNQATNQQVNVTGGAEIPEKNSSNLANELLCEGSNATMDSGSATAASPTYSPMATMEESGR